MSAAVQPAETAPLPPPVAWILSIRATDKLVAADLATRGNFCFGAILPWQAHAAGASLTFQYASDLYGLDAIIDGVSLTFDVRTQPCCATRPGRLWRSRDHRDRARRGGY